MACVVLIILTILALVQNVFGQKVEEGVCNVDNFDCNTDKRMNKEAISAIARAKTEECKDQLRKSASLADNLHPKFIQSGCNFYQEVTYLGCFQSNENTKVFKDEIMKKFPNFNSPYECSKFCSSKNYTLAGMQNGLECYCGNEMVSIIKANKNYCNTECPVFSQYKCGGNGAIGVYDTGIFKSSKSFIGSPKIAYILAFHGRSIRQIMRLFQTIWTKDDFYYIHLDSRSDYLLNHLKFLTEHKNVFITKVRFVIVWGGTTFLMMQMNAFKEILDLKWNFGFVINMSGSDYMVKTPEKLKSYLSKYPGMNFVWGVKSDQEITENGMNKAFVECDHYLFGIGPRQLPKGITYNFGSDWFTLSKDFIEYLVYDRGDPLLQGLFSVYNHTAQASERFFLAALKNSKFCAKHIDHTLTASSWDFKHKQGCPKTRSTSDQTGCSPISLKMNRWNEIFTLMKKEDAFFVRKFDSTIDMTVLNRIDHHIHGKQVPNRYWLNIWHRQYDPNNALQELAMLLTKQEHILELNLLFQNDALDSLLILFEHNGRTQETRYTMKYDEETNAGERISVGNHYDPIDLIFRNKIPVFESEPSFMINSNSQEIKKRGDLYLVSPENTVLSAKRRFPISKKHHIIDIPKEILTDGLWTIVYIDFKNERHVLRFLMVGRQSKMNSRQIELTPYERDILKDVLGSKVSLNSWLQSTFIMTHDCIVDKSCETSFWSSKYPKPYNQIVEKAKPKTTVAFLKTHKCATDTIQNILFRYAYYHNLTVVLPDTGEDIGFGKVIRGFSKNVIKDTTWFKAGLKPQILAVHTVWNNIDAVVEVMKLSDENPILFTILRDPVEVLISMWDYFGYSEGSDLTIDKFFGENKHLSKLSPKFRSLKRVLFNDFGVPFDANEATIEAKIKEIDKKFHLVMIVEEFEGSMVLLKNLLNWPFEDLVSMKLNARVSSKKSIISESTRVKAKKWLNDEYKLYNHFNAKLKSQFKLLHNFDAELKVYQEHQENIKKQCPTAQVEWNSLPDSEHGRFESVMYKVLNSDEQCQLLGMSHRMLVSILRDQQNQKITNNQSKNK